MNRTRRAAFLQPCPLPSHFHAASQVITFSDRSRHVFRSVAPRAQERSPSGEEPSSPEQDNLLQRLEAIPDRPQSQGNTVLADSNGLVQEFITYLTGSLASDIERFLSSPFRLLSAASLSLLFGFFSATSTATIFGALAEWDPLAAAILLVWTEGFTKYYYGLEKRSKLLQLINAFKVGLIFGMTVDAFKLGT